MSSLPRVSQSILSPGRLSDSYEVSTDFLGEGAFSKVYVVTHKASGQRRAMKRVSKKLMQYKHSIDLKPVEVEVALQKRCCKDASNVVQLYDTYDSGDTVDIVLEVMAKKDLFDVIEERFYDEQRKYTEAETSNMIRQIISAVHSCHQNQVTHRDIKPENILVSEGSSGAEHLELKLSDFGLAAMIRSEKLYDTCGTPEYVAPEVIVNPPVGYDKSADVWSIGVILYILLCGEQPFEPDPSASGDAARTISVLEQLRDHTDIESKLMGGAWDHVSTDAKGLLARMFKKDPAQRISTEELLEHPWINGGAGEEHQAKALANLHKQVVKRRFRAAIRALIVTRRIQNFIQGLRAEKACDDVCAALGWGCAEACRLLAQFRSQTTADNAALLLGKDAFAEVLKAAELGADAPQILGLFEAFEGSEHIVNCRDFCVAVAWRSKSALDEKLGFAFDVFDGDGSGSIDEGEFGTLMDTVFATKPLVLSKEGKLEEYRKIDTDGDGTIDRTEFLDYARGNEHILRYLQQVGNQDSRKEKIAGVKEEVEEVQTRLEDAEKRRLVAGEDAGEPEKKGGCCVVM